MGGEPDGVVPPAAALPSTCHPALQNLVQGNQWVWGRVGGTWAEAPLVHHPPRGLRIG